MCPAVIALVDDDEDVRDSIGSLLRAQGMVPWEFASAEALLGNVDHSQIRCLITDVHLPGMDGLRLVAQLRRRCIAYPVIVVSARDPATVCAAGKAIGASVVLSKPIDPSELFASLSRVLPGLLTL